MSSISDRLRASIVVPTRMRLDYLRVALSSIAPQAATMGAELIVVDDAGPSQEARLLTERFGARYEPHPRPLGLNVARNTGVERSSGELVVFVDDDVEVCPDWLEALLTAARTYPWADVFTGPIVARLEGSPPHSCGREGPPITALDLGSADTPTRYAWGSNMAIRRDSLERIGPFDVSLEHGGDEQEWQERLRAEHASHEHSNGAKRVRDARGDDTEWVPTEGGATKWGATGERGTGGEGPPFGRTPPLGAAESGATESGATESAATEGGAAKGGPVMYVAAAKLEHRRTPADARLRPLCRAAFARGKAARRFDSWRETTPSLGKEFLTLTGCVGHVMRYRCAMGLTMVAHSAGRTREAMRERVNPSSSSSSSSASLSPSSFSSASHEHIDDFLSGESGTVGGLDGVRRVALDIADDTLEIATTRRLRLNLAARHAPQPRRVLVLCVARPEHRRLVGDIRAELAHSRHEVELGVGVPAERGKFENLNLLLDTHPASGHDWLFVIDDDIVLPRGFLDRFLLLAERFGLDLAQPAHRRASHAAWQVTRRQALSLVRETCFVEIGPVTAFARSTFSTLLPFPDLRMGWGLDTHWAALAREQGWRCGVIDAVPIRHRAAPAASTYSREQALGEARAFLADRPYLSAAEVQRTLVTHRRL